MNCDLILQLDPVSGIDLALDSTDDFELIVDSAAPEYPIYEGATEFTPPRETQVVLSGGKILLDNITINPIPSNYGLVTYHANIITIS